MNNEDDEGSKYFSIFVLVCFFVWVVFSFVYSLFQYFLDALGAPFLILSLSFLIFVFLRGSNNASAMIVRENCICAFFGAVISYFLNYFLKIQYRSVEAENFYDALKVVYFLEWLSFFLYSISLFIFAFLFFMYFKLKRSSDILSFDDGLKLSESINCSRRRVGNNSVGRMRFNNKRKSVAAVNLALCVYNKLKFPRRVLVVILFLILQPVIYSLFDFRYVVIDNVTNKISRSDAEVRKKIVGAIVVSALINNLNSEYVSLEVKREFVKDWTRMRALIRSYYYESEFREQLFLMQKTTERSSHQDVYGRAERILTNKLSEINNDFSENCMRKFPIAYGARCDYMGKLHSLNENSNKVSVILNELVSEFHKEILSAAGKAITNEFVSTYEVERTLSVIDVFFDGFLIDLLKRKVLPDKSFVDVDFINKVSIGLFSDLTGNIGFDIFDSFKHGSSEKISRVNSEIRSKKSNKNGDFNMVRPKVHRHNDAVRKGPRR